MRGAAVRERSRRYRGPVATRARVGVALERHPLLWSVVLTIGWLAAVHLLAELLVARRSGVEGNLRAAAVNVGALLVPLAVIAAAGWRIRAGLGRGLRWILVLPVAVLYASVLLVGLMPAAVGAVLATALLQLMLGLNEEVMFRGLIQAVWARHRPLVQCTAVALIFGLQHSANVLFGQPVLDTAEQVVDASLTGFTFAAARLRIGSVWPLAAVHALGNFCNDLAADVPLAMYVVIGVLIFAYGLVLVRRLTPGPVEDARPPSDR